MIKRTLEQQHAFSAGLDSVWENNPLPPPTDPDLRSHWLVGESEGEDCRRGYEDENDE